MFPSRAKRLPRPHQLGLGEGWVRVGRCPGCASALGGAGCADCGGFTCQRCDTWTSSNGGDGTCCARCV